MIIIIIIAHIKIDVLIILSFFLRLNNEFTSDLLLSFFIKLFLPHSEDVFFFDKSFQAKFFIGGSDMVL